jgi:hypothetical protein
MFIMPPKHTRESTSFFIQMCHSPLISSSIEN